ncbi:MAG TPA: hypothetical protein VFI31_24880 [Pirellulales bacterium]|nr:hypothetical protein [Pirellulales bacterium]
MSGAIVPLLPGADRRLKGATTMFRFPACRYAAITLCVALLANTASGQEVKGKLDEFGNPVGEHSLAGRNAFKGKRLLAWTSEIEVQQNIFREDNPLWPALEDKGFALELKTGPFDTQWLKTADQLWVFAGRSAGLNNAAVEAIENFVRSGHGLYLAADNAPYLVDANTICQGLFGATVAGDYEGGKNVAVRGRGITRDDYERTSQGRRSGFGGDASSAKEKPPRDLPGRGARVEVIGKASHYVEDHALLTGINFLYEGVTISHIAPSSKMQTVLTASDGQILAAVAKDPKLLVLVDGGWTRYYPMYVTQTAGTLRYAENVAAYLMGKGRRPSGPEGIAALLSAIDAGDANPADRGALAKLDKTPPKYREVQEQLADIWRLASSKKPEVAEAARRQVVNAFLRAPISECMRWLADDDTKLQALIWEQLDDRIARADDERKAAYGEAALAVIAQSDARLASRRAAAQLLGRLKNRAAAERLIELLPTLPRSLWGPIGRALEEITGQDFGPRDGAGVAELNGALKKWRAWSEGQRER